MHVFEVLAEPIRRRIVEVLASGAHYAGDLEAVITHEFGVSRSAVHHHLRLLKRHQVVRVYEDWPYRSYELDPILFIDLRGELRHYERLYERRVGGRMRGDPLAGTTKTLRGHSSRGHRGRGRDPDDPWERVIRDRARLDL